jgi:two-component system sensor histidine kinase HydH
MLKTGEENPLWGFIPYRVVVPLLFGVALLLTALLVSILDRWHFLLRQEVLPGGAAGGISESDLARLAVVALLLGGTAVVSVVILQRYRTTQRELRRVQVLGRNILENMVGGVITLDAEGRITLVNPAARRMLELSPGSRDDLEWLAERQPQLLQAIQEAVQKERYVQDEDFPYNTSAKGVVWLRVTTSPLLADPNIKQGAVVLVKDVTRLRQMEEQMRRAGRLAATETLAAGVAHEVRNPLSAIALNLSLLQEEVFSDRRNREEIENYFEILQAETRRLNRITEEFLALSRPGTFPRQELSVTEAVWRVLRLLEVEAAEKGVRIQAALPENLPSVLGDQERLEQVFLNILINAMDSMPSGGEIQVSAAPRNRGNGPEIDVSIADRGCGIAAEHLPRLFDPYFTTKPNGTGLGLAIAHRIVTDHQGEVVVESTPGAGTRVSVRLPVTTEQTPAQPLGIHESQHSRS